MAEIYDAGASLKVVSGTDVRYIMKQNIREVSVIKGSILKIDIGGGALNNIFIAYADITFPIMANAAQIRDYINNTYLGQLDGSNSLSNLTAITDKIRTELELLSVPLVRDDSNPNMIYEGYAVPATATNAAAWAIKRITQSGSQTSSQWAGGNRNFINVWNDRATLTYL